MYLYFINAFACILSNLFIKYKQGLVFLGFYITSYIEAGDYYLTNVLFILLSKGELTYLVEIDVEVYYTQYTPLFILNILLNYRKLSAFFTFIR